MRINITVNEIKEEFDNKPEGVQRQGPIRNIVPGNIRQGRTTKVKHYASEAEAEAVGGGLESSGEISSYRIKK